MIVTRPSTLTKSNMGSLILRYQGAPFDYKAEIHLLKLRGPVFSSTCGQLADLLGINDLGRHAR